MTWFIAASFLPALVLSFLLTALLRRQAPRWGLVDVPASRKIHARPIPLGGGIAIYLGFTVPVVVAWGLAVWVVREPGHWTMLPGELRSLLPGLALQGGPFWVLLASGTLLAAAGLLDDLRPIPWQPRLCLHVLIASALVAGGIQGTLFVTHPWISGPITVLWIVGLINAMNFLDNMDALAGGTGFIVAIIFATLMLSMTPQPRWLVGGALLCLAGSLLGFLWHNRPPARIFMGDCGSTFLGVTLASLTVLGTFYDDSGPGKHVILAPLCVLAVPLYDTASVIWIRLREGRSPFQPDKSHFSHRLVEMGLSRAGAVRTVHLCTLSTGIGALLLYRVNDWTGAALIMSLVLSILAMIAVLESAVRRNSNRNAAGSQSAVASSGDQV